MSGRLALRSYSKTEELDARNDEDYSEGCETWQYLRYRS